jgi:hypothetical protein
MLYMLWDTETSNLIAEHCDIEQALDLVRLGIERNGPRDTDALLQQMEDGHGEVRRIASDPQLTALARRHA